MCVAMSSQIRVQVLTTGFVSSIPTFVVFIPIWTSRLWLDQIMFSFVLSLKSDRRHLSELPIPGFGCPQQRLQNSTPAAQGMALYVREGFCSFRQSKLKCSCHESDVFRICRRINNFYVYAFYCNQGNDGSDSYVMTVPTLCLTPER